MRTEPLLQLIASTREAILRGWLTMFNPRRLKAKDYDARLARSIEKRWNDDEISIFRLVYERTDNRGTCDASGENVALQPLLPPVEAAPQALLTQIVPAASGTAVATGSSSTGQANETGAAQGAVPTAKNFLVFIDPHLEVDWLADFELEAESERLIAAAESCAAVDCDFLAKRQLLGYRLQIAQVIVCAIQGQNLDGQRLLAEANSYLNKRVVERSRQWILMALVTSGLFSLVSTACYVGGFDKLTSVSPLLGSLQGGFLGAFVSVAAKTGRAQCDAAAGWGLHFLEVLMRLTIGVVFGGVSVALAGSSLGPEPAKALIASPEGLLILSFASGLFEQTVPRMLSKYSPLKETSET